MHMMTPLWMIRDINVLEMKKWIYPHHQHPKVEALAGISHVDGHEGHLAPRSSEVSRQNTASYHATV